jgi:uncharacterized protein (DUF2147 family)
MTFHRIGILVLFLAILATASFAAEDPDAIIGIWVTEQKEPGDPYSHIEVELRDGKYAGKIVWLNEPVYEEGDPEAGKTLHDRENPDESLRDRPLLGMDLMHSFRFDKKDGKWVDGKIYDPEAGKEYNCKVTMKDPDTLEVFGYIKIGFVKMGRDTIWKRAP